MICFVMSNTMKDFFSLLGYALAGVAAGIAIKMIFLT